MVGIVFVSHSATLARGALELARAMAGPDVPLEAAGGTDDPEAPLGTDAALVAQAIERAHGDGGVLVLMDLGSAVMSAEMALDFLDEEHRAGVLLCAAPLVEGGVAAAASARAGQALEEVAAEARRGLIPKQEHLGDETPDVVPRFEDEGPQHVARVELTNRLGLHARPAAHFVHTAARFDARVSVTNVTTEKGPASARSLTGLARLGARRGHSIEIAAGGPEASAAVAALEELVADGFGDADEAPSAPPRAPEESTPREDDGAEPSDNVLRGVPASPGAAWGPARRLGVAPAEVPQHAAADPDAEWARLEHALAATRAEITAARATAATSAGEAAASIFDAYVLMLEDEALVEHARRLITEEMRNAAAAWHEVTESTAREYRELEDDYQAGRADDLLHLEAQVLVQLGGEVTRPALGEPGVLITGDLVPAEVASLDPGTVRALATVAGGPTSHGAILARALGIPAVVGLGPGLESVGDGVLVLVDGDSGVVLVDPEEDELARYEKLVEQRRASAAAALAAAAGPAETADGDRIEVMANAAALADADAAVVAGADGIGLLRTELLFAAHGSPPGEDEHYEALHLIASALEGRPLTVRTLDAGADKPLAFLARPPEDNPALGVRGLRLGLAEPRVLRTQLRAVVRVAEEHPVRVMFPMVSTIAELRAAVALLDEDRDPDARLEVGMMVEVPGAALMASEFASELDFFSIGTNDLAQYVMAADRTNPGVAELADALHPAVLRTIAMVTEAAAAHGIRVAVCGELAGEPVATPLLLGLGVGELSATPRSIPAVKEAVRATRGEAARALAGAALELDSAAAVRSLLATESGP